MEEGAPFESMVIIYSGQCTCHSKNASSIVHPNMVVGESLIDNDAPDLRADRTVKVISKKLVGFTFDQTKYLHIVQDIHTIKRVARHNFLMTVEALQLLRKGKINDINSVC